MRIITKGNPTEPMVALTFDDGPDFVHLPPLLRLLKQHDVKATFFWNGMPNLEAVTTMREAGHEVGCHGRRHLHPAELPDNVLRRDLQDNQQAIAGTLYRPPGGAEAARMGRIADELGLTTVMWSVDTLDYKGEQVVEVERRLKMVNPGDIVLMHEAWAHWPLEITLRGLKSRGLKFVTVSTMLQSGPGPNGANS